MAWANQRVYSAVQTLPDSALNSYIVNSDWTVGVILEHILAGSEWYVYCLTASPLTRFTTPTSMQEVGQLAKSLAERDRVLRSEADKDDELLTIEQSNGTFKNLRSTVISQAVHHATEHRAQLVDALEFRGHTPILLDDIDLWAFETVEKAHS